MITMTYRKTDHDEIHCLFLQIVCRIIKFHLLLSAASPNVLIFEKLDHGTKIAYSSFAKRIVSASTFCGSLFPYLHLNKFLVHCICCVVMCIHGACTSCCFEEACRFYESMSCLEEENNTLIRWI